MGIKVAIPKGRLGKKLTELLKQCGVGASIDLNSRRLIFKDEENDITYTLLKNADVITYVENGIADIGVVGSDMIMESDADIYLLEKLGIGQCKMAVAGIEGKELVLNDMVLRVATKFPKIAKQFFTARGQKIKIIRLNGSIELAPVLGLSDVIVDIVESGNTLRANGLAVFEEICDISGYVISNKVSYKFNRCQIDRLIEKITEGNYDKNYRK